MSRVWILSTCLTVIAAAGCGPAYFGSPISPDQTAESLAGILKSRRGSEPAISSRLTLRIKGRIGKTRMKHRITGIGVFAEDRARVTFDKSFIPVLSVLSIGDDLTIYLPRNDKGYKGDAMERLVEEGRLPADFHLDPLTFFMPVVVGRSKNFKKGGKHHIIETDLGGGFYMRYIILAATGIVVINDFIDPDNKVILRKVYDRFKEVDGLPIPTLVKFNAPRGGVKGTLRMGRINLSPRIRKNAFSMRIPRGIPIEDIGLKKQEVDEAAESTSTGGSPVVDPAVDTNVSPQGGSPE